MFREAVIAYLILVCALIFFVSCTFYVRSYHDDHPYLEKEEKCVGIKCLDTNTNTKRKNLAEKTDADGADVKNNGAVR